MGQHEGGVGEDARVVRRHLERLPGEIAALAAGCLRFSAQPSMTSRKWQTAAQASAGP